MIIFIIVPPDKMFEQRTMHDLFYPQNVMLPKMICIVPESEAKTWWGERPWLQLLTYDEYDLRKIRTMILDEFENEDIHMIARYDLALSRRLPSIQRLSTCTKKDIGALMKWIQGTGRAHGSISERRRNKIISKNEASVMAPSLLNFYRPEVILDADFDDYNFLDAPETLIDHDLTLFLLRTHHENVINYEFACRSVSEGTLVSPFSVTKEDAFKLEKRHPGLVEAVEVKPGTWNVICQWSRAYDACRETRR